MKHTFYILSGIYALFLLPLQISPSTLFCTMIRQTCIFSWLWLASEQPCQENEDKEDWIFVLLISTFKLCPALMSLFPCRHPSPHSYLFSWILKTSYSICFLYQLVATAPPLLALVPEPSLMVSLYIAHNFVISLFVK